MKIKKIVFRLKINVGNKNEVKLHRSHPLSQVLIAMKFNIVSTVNDDKQPF